MSLEVLWEPRPDVLETSRVGDFIRRFGLGFTTYDELWQWSVDDLPGFWRAVWDYFDVISDTPPEAVLSTRVMPGAHWFVGTRLNYAEHVLRMPGIADDDLAKEIGDAGTVLGRAVAAVAVVLNPQAIVVGSASRPASGSRPTRPTSPRRTY